MILAYLIYTILPLFVIIFTYNGRQYRRNDNASPKTWVIWSIIIVVYTVIIGLREDVGIDYTSYKVIINNLLWNEDYGRDQDLIFYLFLPIIRHLHYNIFIAFLAFVTILYQYLVLKDKARISVYFIALFFITTIFFKSLNIMRQNAALFVVLYSLNLCDNKQYVKSLLHFSLAFIIHKSIILVIPVYYFGKNFFKVPRNIQIIVVVFVFIFGSLINKGINSYIETVGIFLTQKISFLRGYAIYVENYSYWTERGIEMRKSTEGTGVTNYIFLIMNLIVISLSDRVNKMFKHQKFSTYYGIYILGQILGPIFYYSEFMSRVVGVFDFFKLYIYSMTLFYIFTEHKGKYSQILKFVVVLLFLAMVMFYYLTIYRQRMEIAPYHFL